MHARARARACAHAHMECEPQVHTIDLIELRSRGLSEPRLVIASDGLWDLWTFEEVAAQLRSSARRGAPACGATVGPAGDDCPLCALVAELCEVTRAKGEDYFGEAADNLTGLVVDIGAYFDDPHRRAASGEETASTLRAQEGICTQGGGSHEEPSQVVLSALDNLDV